MAVDFQSIIDAIDQAILDWAGQPVTMTSTQGRTTTYRSLDELIKARRDYASLLKSQQGKLGFGINALTSGGAV